VCLSGMVVMKGLNKQKAETLMDEDEVGKWKGTRDHRTSY
jgi:hypothetical protein